MQRDFLVYWRPTTLDEALASGRLFSYAASNQFDKVAAGDTVWAVSVRSGRLHLAGRLVVAQLTDRDGAGQAVGTEGLWEAEHYLLPAPGTVRPVVDIDIHHLAPQLRFEGTNDRLDLAEDGSVNAQQLQTMRLLAGNSAQLLADALGV
jgi:hypothetical protein